MLLPQLAARLTKCHFLQIGIKYTAIVRAQIARMMDQRGACHLLGLQQASGGIHIPKLFWRDLLLCNPCMYLVLIKHLLIFSGALFGVFRRFWRN